MASSIATLRELDHRSDSEMEVTLLWEPATDRVFIFVHTDNWMNSTEINGEDASEAFAHPIPFLDSANGGLTEPR